MKRSFASLIFFILAFNSFSQSSDTTSCIIGLDTLTFAITYNQEQCNGLCTGDYTIDVLQGSGGYSYSTTGTSYSSLLVTDTNLCSGNYNSSVTDLGSGITCDLNYVINSFSNLTYSISLANCTGYGLCNGTATLTINGGVPPYAITWYEDILGTSVPIPNEDSTFLDSLCAGTYYFEILDNTTACPGGIGNNPSGPVQFTITQPDPLVLILQNVAVACGYTASNGSSFIGDGAISTLTQGGQPPYSYQLNGAPFPSGNISDAPIGYNTITVTDANMNTATITVYVGWEKVGYVQYTFTNETCPGACDASVTIGSIFQGESVSEFAFITHTYILENLTNSSTQNIYPGQVINNLCPGQYVAITDPFHLEFCSDMTPPFTIQSGVFSPNLTVTVIDETCVNACDGSISIFDQTSLSTQYSVGGSYTPSNTFNNLCASPYPVSVKNANGCVYDYGNVILNQGAAASFGIDVQTDCDSYTWIDGVTYSASNNTATIVLANAAGCDSTVTLDLTINYSTSSTDVISACDSYTWIDGNTYTSSNNSASYLLSTTAGCDSLVTLDLTLNYSSGSTDVVTACDSYTWIDGNTYTTSNNTATMMYTNVANCDSTVILDLTINYSNGSTDVIMACDSYVWLDGNTYTVSNNVATMVYTNVAGCDSIVTLNLTISYSNGSTDVISACDSYTWINGITYTSSTNVPTSTLTNSSGCDSVVTLNLSITTSSYSSPVNINSCDSYTSSSGNQTWSTSGLYYDTILSANGCDSIIPINLTIQTIDLTILNISNTLVSMQSNAEYKWVNCSNYSLIPGETNQTFVPQNGGDYAVILTKNNCTDTTECVKNYVHLSENLLNETIKLYPNPTKGYFTIELGELRSKVDVEITNSMGQVISNESFNDLKNVEMKLKGERGVYFVRITIDGAQTTIPLIKQ